MATNYSGKILICLYRNHVRDLNELNELAKNAGFSCVICPVSHPNFFRETDASRPISDNHSSFRPDLECEGTKWRESIFMRLSDDIDCESSDEAVRKHGERTLVRELQWTNYLSNHGCFVFRLKFRESVNSARTLLSQLSQERRALIQVSWVNPDQVKQSFRSPNLSERGNRESSWYYWNRFRLVCDFHPSVGVLLEITKDVPSNMEINRWMAEPVDMILVSTTLFERNRQFELSLPEPYKGVIERFLMQLNVHISIEGADKATLDHYVRYFQNMIGRLKSWPNKDDVELLREPRSIEPHQPSISANWTSILTSYQNAMEAIFKSVKDNVSVMIFGTGARKLVEIFRKASEKALRPPNLYVFEENQWKAQDILTFTNVSEIKVITSTNESEFHQKMHVMVCLPFELSHSNQYMQIEFRRLQRFLRSNGITVPESTSLLIAPIMSSKMYNKIRLGPPAVVAEDKTTDLLNYNKRVNQIFTVAPRNFQRIAHETSAFAFPNNPNQPRDEDDVAPIEFQVDIDCVLTGFVGYFSAKLFSGIEINTRTMDEHSNVLSPRPNLYPIRIAKDLKMGQKLQATFYRQFDSTTRTMTMEWSVEKPFIIPIHSSKGLYDKFLAA